MNDGKQGRGKILYLNGSFQPTTNQNGPDVIGKLHVCLSGVPEGVAIASTLFACGCVEVLIIFTIYSLDFVCSPQIIMLLGKYAVRSWLHMWTMVDSSTTAPK